MSTLGGTASGSDAPALVAALLDVLPYTHERPTRMTRALVEAPSVEGWKEELLAAKVDKVTVWWGDDHQLGRSRDVVAFDLPDAIPLDARAVVQFYARLPIELAVLSTVHDYWLQQDYFAPAIGGDQALLGWGMVFKGAGHERSLVSRRWLDYGPFRTVCGSDDTTLAQFHDLTADGPTSLAQVQPAHDWIVAGFLRPKHRYQHDIKGIYTKEDGLLRVLVNDRDVSDEELLDACAARRDGRTDPAKPIKNIAYVFVEEKPARARLEALWLRELECRVADGRGERRLDVDYQPSIKKPSWVRS